MVELRLEPRSSQSTANTIALSVIILIEHNQRKDWNIVANKISNGQSKISV